jgi:hypothetical protein
MSNDLVSMCYASQLRLSRSIKPVKLVGSLTECEVVVGFQCTSLFGKAARAKIRGMKSDSASARTIRSL